MDKFKTIGVGGLPHTLNDFRQFLGRLDAPSEGIYQAFNNLIRGFGDNFIVQGCVLSGSTGAFSITEGWVLLDGELIKVDAQGPFDEANDSTFVKVTTFDSRGTKTFLNGSINETYEKNRAVIQGTSGNLDFDGATLLGIVGNESWLLQDFSAGDYTASTGTWVASIRTLKSIIRGKTMTVSIEVNVSILSGGPTIKLFIAVPQSKVVTSVMTAAARIVFGGAPAVPCTLKTVVGSNLISIEVLDGTDITNGGVGVNGTITFEID